MTTGISYPLAPEVKEEIEKKRKEFAKRIGVKPNKISQPKFSKFLINPISKYNIPLKYGNKNTKKK